MTCRFQKNAAFMAVLVVSVGIPDLIVGQAGDAIEGKLPLKPPLVGLNTTEGRQLLYQSRAQEPFWTLAQNFETQQDLGSCSVASCVMVLNALNVPAPDSAAIRPFRRHSPANFFNEHVEKVVPAAKVSNGGMTLEQVHSVLQTFPVSSRLVFAGDVDIDQLRRDLREQLASADRQIIVNYHRKALGQQGGGHISPVAAYDEKQEMVLIADTAGYKYPWTWAPVSALWEAMASYKDGASGKTRGYVVVSKTERAVP